MRRLIIWSIIILILSTALTMGCFEDSGDDDKKKSNKPPEANAGEDVEVFSLEEVQFDAGNSSDPDGNIVSFEWDFDDYNTAGKETSFEEKPSYIYQFPGEYWVTLTVTDDDGKATSDTIQITVKNRAPLVEIGEDISVRTYEIVYFNVSSDDIDGYIKLFQWDFDGDGNFDWHAATTGSTTHFYTEPGVYNATISVIDNLDSVTIKNRIITITELINLPPIAEAGLNQTLPVGNVSFKGTGLDPDGFIVLYEWDFDGDGNFDWSSDESGIAEYSYYSEGVYFAKLKVTDDAGLTALDSVKITINNSYIAQNVSVQIYINWSQTHDYILITNDSINLSRLKIVITDIVTNDEEEFDNSNIMTIDEFNFKLTSKTKPIPGHTLKVQVLYYDTLIGARNLEIINESTQIISPELDFSAVYTINEELVETNRSELEIIRITSIGDVEVEQEGGLLYTSMHGTGEYYVYDEFEGSESEITIECTDLWVNTTQSGSKIISQSISILGTGEMVATFEDSLLMEIDIKKMMMITENNIELENYMYGEGTFSGTSTDPDTGIEIKMTGDVTLHSELIGHGKHENFAGDEFECSIQYTNMTMDGTVSATTGGPGIKMESMVENVTWNVDYEKYDNNTIYYEYIIVNIVANQIYYDSGSGYPDDSPTIREEEIHIEEAMTFDTPMPKILIGSDIVILESNYGIKLQLDVIGEFDKKIDDENYECVEIKGQIIEGGRGSVKLCIIKTGTFSGITVTSTQNLYWKDESLKIKQTLKQIRNI